MEDNNDPLIDRIFGMGEQTPEVAKFLGIYIMEIAIIEMHSEMLGHVGAFAQVNDPSSYKDATPEINLLKGDYVKALIDRARGRIRVARPHLKDADERMKLLAEAEALNDARNRYLHAMWYADLNTNTRYMTHKPKQIGDQGGGCEVTVSTLQDEIKKVRNWANRVIDLIGANINKFNEAEKRAFENNFSWMGTETKKT